MKVWPITRRPRRPPRPPRHFSALAIACDVCGAAPGEPCAPGCCTAQDPGITGNHEDSDPAPGTPGEPCPDCHYTPSDQPCEECGANAGERCLPHCTAPFGPGGPYEHHDPADHDEQ